MSNRQRKPEPKRIIIPQGAADSSQANIVEAPASTNYSIADPSVPAEQRATVTPVSTTTQRTRCPLCGKERDMPGVSLNASSISTLDRPNGNSTNPSINNNQTQRSATIPTIQSHYSVAPMPDYRDNPIPPGLFPMYGGGGGGGQPKSTTDQNQQSRPLTKEEISDMIDEKLKTFAAIMMSSSRSQPGSQRNSDVLRTKPSDESEGGVCFDGKCGNSRNFRKL